MKSLVSEFMQYAVTPEELGTWAEKEELLRRKLRMCRWSIRGLRSISRKNNLTAEELPALLCGVIGDSRLVKGSTVVLDGFTGFTPAQCRVLEQLFRLCRRVYVTAALDQREDLYRKDSPHRLFHMTRKMIRKLTETRRGGRSGSAGALLGAAREEEPFRGQPGPGLSGTSSVPLRKRSLEGTSGGRYALRGGDSAMEMQYAAALILRLVREKGCRFRDFAVVAGDLSGYGKEAARAFAASGIPCFVDEKKPALANPFVEFIRAALDMAVQNYSYESVFRYLRWRFSGFAEDELDRLENYVLALGIHGRKQYQERWVRSYRGAEPLEAEEMNELRQRFLEEIGAFADGMRERKAPAARRIRVLYDLIVNRKAQQKLKSREEAFALRGEAALQKEYAQIYGIVMRFSG